MNPDVSPPKRLSSQLVHLDHTLKTIERDRYAGIRRAPDSLPVLEAFQAFLDQERRRMQRRLVGVALILLLVTVGVGGGAVGVTWLLALRVTDQQRLIETQRQDIDVRVQALVRGAAESGLQSSRALSKLTESFEQDRADWRRRQAEMGAGQAALEDGHRLIELRLAAFEEVMAGLARGTDVLSLTNAMAKSGLADTDELDEDAEGIHEFDTMTVLDSSVEQFDEHLAGEHLAGEVETLDEPEREVIAPSRFDPIAVTGKTLRMSIVPRGATLPIGWLVPSVASPE